MFCSAKRLKDRRKTDKFAEVDEREEAEDKDKPIKIINDQADKVDSNRLLSPKSGNLPNGSSRSGASSPSPSDGTCVCTESVSTPGVYTSRNKNINLHVWCFYHFN